LHQQHEFNWGTVSGKLTLPPGEDFTEETKVLVCCALPDIPLGISGDEKLMAKELSQFRVEGLDQEISLGDVESPSPEADEVQ